jgi:hypothetical protein
VALFRVRKQLSHQLFIDLVVNPRKQGIYAYRHWQCNTEKECQKTGASADDNKDYQYRPKNYSNHMRINLIGDYLMFAPSLRA